MASSSSGVSALGWLKSKRSRSGPTIEPFCDDMRAQHALERGMQQMRGRMIGAGGPAPLAIDAQLHRLAQLEFAARHLHDMDMQRAQLLLGVDHFAFAAVAGEDRAMIADLAAGFAIEGRLVGEDAHGLAGLRASRHAHRP